MYDICLYRCTNNIKLVLNYVCYTQVLQLTPLFVTINPVYGVVTLALLSLSVQLYENGRS